MPDLYNYVGRLQRKLEEIKNSKDISKHNKDKILEFQRSCLAHGLSKARMLRYLNDLLRVAKKLKKDFEKVKKSDIEAIIAEIETTNLAPATKTSYDVTLKKFYKWLREEEGLNLSKYEYPNEVKWINTGKKQNKKKLPQELLNTEDVKKLAENTNNLRDRAFILSLYESGGRIGEISNIKIKDIENDKYGSLITLSGKTGSRKIRIIASSPAISNWLLEHPNRQDKNDFLFCCIWGKKRGVEIRYNTLRKLLKKTAEKANINKPVNPHHFRHSRATELAKSFTESQLCEYFGWIQGSKEAATYVHLSGRDMDTAVLKIHGIIDVEEEEKSKFRIIKCPRCKTKNSPGSKFCSNCSLGLDLKAMNSFEKTKDDISSNILSLIQDKESALQTLNALTKLIQNH